MKRKPRSYEKTCDCTAYPFPHRLLGGRCDGSVIVQNSFNASGLDNCGNCTSFSCDGCQVLDGREDTKHAACVQDYIRYEGIRPPASWQARSLTIHRAT